MNNNDDIKVINLKTPEDVRECILNEGIIYNSERQGDSLYIPAFDLLLTPNIEQMSNTGIGIEFNMYIKKLDKYLYEYSSGMGGDITTAVGMSMSSFLISFMNTFEIMYNKCNPINITTEFACNEHNWDVYLGNVTGMGTPGEDGKGSSATYYWDIIKDDIIKRLGNQKMVYVKIYAARLPENSIGEVRFDDVAIPELSEQVRKLAEKWNVEQFGSEKQFIFIEQNPSTITASQYDGPEGRKKMREFVFEYLKMVGNTTTEEQYNNLVKDFGDKIGDKVLANECFGFLPEMATICALGDRIVVSDQIQICLPDNKTINTYSTQLSDYPMLEKCLMDIMRSGELGEQTNNVWQRLIGTSALIRLFNKRQEAGDQASTKLITLLYNVDSNFKLR
jgi:hypothetical protein